MGRLATAYGQAVAAHRQAVQRYEKTRLALDAQPPPPLSSAELVGRLARLGGQLAAPAPGVADLGGVAVPVRIGEATTLDGVFPVLVPLGGGNHLVVDTDARDPRVGELLRTTILRLLALAPAGEVRVAGIDPVAFGAAFLPLRPLLDAGVLAPPATTAAEVSALLDEAERHARGEQQPGGRNLLLLVAASVPPAPELARLAALTHAGPSAALCVLLAGYPPAGAGDPPPLGPATALRLNERYAQVGDPAGQPFSPDGNGLAAPVLLDGGPLPGAVAGFAQHLDAAKRRTFAAPRTEPLPAPREAEPADDGPRPVTAFEEYAALARQLSARQRGGEWGVPAEAERRRALQTAADQLGHRLAAQGQRLDQLGRVVDATPPAPVPAQAPATPLLATAATTAVPGRSVVGAYPEGLAGETGATAQTGGTTAAVPGPRPAEGDLAAELAAVRQLTDEADRYGQQAEALARRPALLPTWSPLTRAVAVYAGCALAGAVLMLLMAVAPQQSIGLGAVLAVTCTGVPVASFLAGHLVLGRWGRPVLGDGPPPSRFAPLGFVICALLSPSLYCTYVLLFRLLR